MEYNVESLLKRVNTAYVKDGDERIRAITEDLVAKIFDTIVKYDVSHDEMWDCFKWMNEVGATNQWGLVAAGFGIERLLDIMMDEKDKQAGKENKTPRAIEGPLYIPGAPEKNAFDRIDDGTETGETLIMRGKVLDQDGKPVANAVVDIWLANQTGAYSHIDPTQSEYNNRRKIITDGEGNYAFQTLTPPGYAVPPGSPTDAHLQKLGRHGHRPAHIHFMVSAAGFNKITTQINIPNDKYLNDDFAFATRDDLVVTMNKVSEASEMQKYDLNKPFDLIEFNFNITAN